MPRISRILACLLIVAVSFARADSPDAATSGRSTLRIRPSPAEGQPPRLAAPAATSSAQPTAPVVRPVAPASAVSTTAEDGPAGLENVPAPLLPPTTIPDTGSIRVPGSGPFFSATPGCDVLGPAPCNCSPDGRRAGCGCLFGTGQFCPAPLGQCVFSAMTPQVVNGWAAQMVFYRFDFSAPTDAKGQSLDASFLAPAGWKRVAKVADILGHAAPPPVIIEASDNIQLDEARRQNVIAALAKFCGTPVPSEWVVVGPSPVPQLRGKEAVIINDNLLRQTLNGGAFAPNDRYSGNGVNSTSGNDNQVNR
jgi:hypothetical protein